MLTITEMRKRNTEAGGNWFSKETMKFFGTKIETRPNKDNVFITSEWADFSETKRAYTLRKFIPEKNNVETIGDFLQYSTLEEAKEVRKHLTNK